MNRSTYRILFASAGIALIALTTVIYLSTVFPYPATGQRFFVLSTLGKNKTAEEYYPNHGSISVGFQQEVKWHIGIQNFMQSAQFVQIRVKVLNSTMLLPDSSKLQPSPEPNLFNLSIFLVNGQSAILPFYWHISDRSISNSSLTLKKIIVNELPVSLNVQSPIGGNLRLILELWHYDVASNTFKFDWDSRFGFECAWNSIMFSAS